LCVIIDIGLYGALQVFVMMMMMMMIRRYVGRKRNRIQMLDNPTGGETYEGMRRLARDRLRWRAAIKADLKLKLKLKPGIRI